MKSPRSHAVPYLWPRSTVTAWDPVLLHSSRICEEVSARLRSDRLREPRGPQPSGRSRKYLIVDIIKRLWSDLLTYRQLLAVILYPSVVFDAVED
ncbi:hypothetical protein STEG23_021487 [Scotinomys teguina]